MILLADSGSTKTEWRFLVGNKVVKQMRTAGYNPHHQTTEQIKASLQQELLPHLENHSETISHIHFYGAGCSSPKSIGIVEEAFAACFPEAKITIEHDLLAAARALCGKEAGIACILGTGSNSCYYNGEQVTHNVPALGYILGDEGSGTHLGKRLLSDFLRNAMPADLHDSFSKSYPISTSEVLDKLYRQAFPKPYLAGFSQFISQHRQHPYCQQILQENFGSFLKVNILQYANHSNVPVHFVGSIAYHFQEELEVAITQLGLNLGTIIQSPMEGLINYHAS